MKYDFTAIERKWQQRWKESNVFHAVTGDATRPKWYGLVEFPYPSGQGLHVGHARPYTAMDVVARKKRMDGCNVLFPIGYDAFGLPTENYAIKMHVHPAKVTADNIHNFRSQLEMLGYSFDWDREINTTDPGYYKWTQWIFLQLFKHGLAYKTSMPVNWCTSCKCVLANEEVVNGVCERCGAPVVRKEKSQWMLRITEYAQKLIDGLDGLDFIPRVVTQQKNWIGRSTGAEVNFNTTERDVLTVYTTRCDTLFGATYMVIAPEHAFVAKWADKLENLEEVRAYICAAASKSDFERTELAKEKTGVELKGVRAINPLTSQEIPIFISDYVLASYGTGAIMAVPAHDSRDWDFAKAFGLPIVQVVASEDGAEVDVQKAAFTDVATGVMVNSGFITGMSVEDAKAAMIEYLKRNGIGRAKVNYKLRDWVFSRQRYWGEPIPIVKCPKCGYVPLPEDQLPLVLPEVESYETTDDGESPLSAMRSWVETTCPCCGGKAERETDTMPQWAGSSWYFLRYMDPHNPDALAGKEALDYWGQVDWYNGGMEHTTLHLLYSRFWNSFLHDIGVVPYAEPYRKRTSHGMILGEGGEKMSKSRGNVVNPNDIVKEYGADTMRTYIMFIGDFAKAAAWSPKAVAGCKRFLDRVWNLQDMAADSLDYSAANEAEIHKAIKKVSDDVEAMKFNTAIATLMALVNSFYANGLTRGDLKALVLMLSPVAPHICEEMWQNLGGEGMVCQQSWPAYDESKTVASTVELAVQIGGKMRGNIQVPTDSEQDAVVAAVQADSKLAKYTDGMDIVKVILVKNRLVNLILKPKS